MRKRNISITIIITIIIILFYTGISLGKAYSKSTINGDTKIAKPILEVENGNKVNITNQNPIGEYEFKVRNYKNQDDITEVDMEYYVEILTPINKNIKINLLKEGKEVEIKENKTDIFIMKANVMQTDNYKINIEYDKTKNYNMEDIIQELQIKIHSQQKSL